MKYMRMKIRDENDSLNNQKIICLIDNSLFFFAFQIIVGMQKLDMKNKNLKKKEEILVL